jgi:hypothetical protein
MRRLYIYALAALGTATLTLGGVVLAQQGATVNPVPGSVWTYLGPTIGADWVAIPAAGSSPQTANYIYAGPASGGNSVPTFRPMVSNDILPSPVLRGDPQAPTPPLGDSDTSLATTAFVKGQNYLTAATLPPALSASCANIVDYGGIGNGVGDNVAAFNAAKAAARCIVFPAGKFRFNSGVGYTMTANYQAVTIKGEGQDVTSLYFPNAMGVAGLTITMMGPNNSFHVRDLTMTTAQLNADTALYIDNTMTSGTYAQSSFAANDVTRVTFRAEQGYARGNTGTPITQGWKYGFTSNKVSVIDFVGVQVFGPTPVGTGYHTQGSTGGTGIQVGSNDPNLSPVMFNFDRVSMNWVENGIIYANNAQGLQIANSNFVGCWSGIYVPTGITGQAQLSVSNSQFNNQYNILLITAMPQLQVTGNTFYVPPSGAGIEDHDKSFITQIVGNSFLGVSTGVGTGISLTPSTADLVPAVITGNTFYRLDAGVNLGGNVDGVLVSSNIFRQNNLNLVNASTNPRNVLTESIAATTPKYAGVSGAANAGGLTRLTVNATGGFVTGEMVLVGSVGGIGGIGAGQFAVTSINVIDATHMDLNSILFSGTYTSGGIVTSLPP